MPIVEFAVPEPPQTLKNEALKSFNPERFLKIFEDIEALLEFLKLETLKKPLYPCGGFKLFIATVEGMQGASDGGVVVDEMMWLRTAPACRLPTNVSCGGRRGARLAWGALRMS